MYFSVAQQQLNLKIPKKVKQFCYNQQTDQLLIILSKKQFIVYNSVSKNTKNNKLLQSQYLNIQNLKNVNKQIIFNNNLQNEQKQKQKISNFTTKIVQQIQGQYQEWIKNKQKIIFQNQNQHKTIQGFKLNLQKQYSPQSLTSFKNFFFWYNSKQNSVIFLKVNKPKSYNSQITYHIDSFTLNQQPLKVTKKFHFLKQSFYVLNRSQYQNAISIQEYQIYQKKISSLISIQNIQNQKEKKLIQKLIFIAKSSNIPIANHYIYKFTTQKCFIFFDQTLCEEHKILRIRFPKASQTINTFSQLLREFWQIKCFKQQDLNTTFILDVNFYDNQPFLILNTCSSAQVKHIQWNQSKKMLNLQGYLAFWSEMIQNSLILLVQDRFNEGRQQIIITNFITFEINYKFDLKQSFICSQIKLSNYKIIYECENKWSIISFLPKKYSYLKILANLNLKEEVGNQLQNQIQRQDLTIKQLYKDILDLL